MQFDQLKRRDFITLLGGATAWPVAARAQQPDLMRRIGVLMGYAENDSEAQTWVAAFREGLQKLGWTEGRNIRIDTRWPDHKLTGDHGNGTEATKIGGRRTYRLSAGKSSPGNFRLLQQYRHIAAWATASPCPRPQPDIIIDAASAVVAA
jgi:hypothetical protein